jgi:hypothetical protein
MELAEEMFLKGYKVLYHKISAVTCNGPGILLLETSKLGESVTPRMVKHIDFSKYAYGDIPICDTCGKHISLNLNWCEDYAGE